MQEGEPNDSTQPNKTKTLGNYILGKFIVIQVRQLEKGHSAR